MRNQHHEELVKLLDTDLVEKLTPEEREKIYALCVSAMHNARISAEKKLPPQPDDYPVDGPPNEELPLVTWGTEMPVIIIIAVVFIIWMIIK